MREYSIKYYEVRTVGTIVEDTVLDSETSDNALDAMWEAQAWLNGDEDRTVRTILIDPETVYMYGTRRGEICEDLVAVIETVHTD